MFAVVINGAPGAGKTVTLMALSDALVKDEIAHAVVDVDEVAWAWPYPSDDERFTLLGASWEAHRQAEHELLLVGEVVESNDRLSRLLASVGADDHLHVRLEAAPAKLRERIMEREPPSWSGLDYLLNEMERWAVVLQDLDGVHVALDTEALSPDQCAGRIRAARPDRLGG